MGTDENATLTAIRVSADLDISVREENAVYDVSSEQLRVFVDPQCQFVKLRL